MRLPSALLACLFVAAPLAGQGPPASRPAGEGLLDGTAKSFLIVGYSTSYAWPAMLQSMLDEHAGRRIYHVLNAVAGGAAVEIWNAEPGSRNHQRTIAATQRDFFGKEARLRGRAPEPRIALAQQSLQFTRTRRGPVADAEDAEGIRIGARALRQLADRLKALGIERVHFAMHIYKKPVEPEVGNERLALAALLEQGLPHVFAGPDVWKPTKRRFPDCFEEDGVHPNETGMKIMAEAWYRHVAGEEAREAVVESLGKKELDVRAMMREYLAWRRDGGEAPGLRFRKKR